MLSVRGSKSGSWHRRHWRVVNLHARALRQLTECLQLLGTGCLAVGAPPRTAAVEGVIAVTEAKLLSGPEQPQGMALRARQWRHRARCGLGHGVSFIAGQELTGRGSKSGQRHVCDVGRGASFGQTSKNSLHAVAPDRRPCVGVQRGVAADRHVALVQVHHRGVGVTIARLHTRVVRACRDCLHAG